MGLYLNQLPQTEVARLKAELAETLIANFCYPRFYDYRVSSLRTRPVDRAKRQEVWQYLNAVDFNVWGRVDVDSPEFQRQVERLFIHFVQRNRSFFGQQGRKRMSDVRSLITSRALELADGLRGHLRGQPGSRPFGSPHAASSWSTANVTGHAEVSWEQILSGTMLLQQQLQEARGEMRPSSSPVPSTPSMPVPVSRSSSGSVPARRPRTARPLVNGNGAGGNSGAAHEEEAALWSAASSKSGKPGESPLAAPFPPAAQAELSSFATSAEVSPTLPLALGKIENMATTFQPAAPVESSPSLPTRSRRSKQVEAAPAPAGAGPFVAPPPSGPLSRQASQPVSAPISSVAVPVPVGQSAKELAVKQAENGAAAPTDEDVVIFEQMRHQLIIWLRVEAVRAGLESASQNTFQLVDMLRRQDGVDAARVQIVSTLLNMCDQIISSGKASLFDYKQAMMFYLMHTRRGQ
ncbi:MAG TPA: hypothetical protein VF458_05915 [Ktedonobacteraceae bacterium]